MTLYFRLSKTVIVDCDSEQVPIPGRPRLRSGTQDEPTRAILAEHTKAS